MIKWQTMETAPKDRVLLFFCIYDYRDMGGRYVEMYEVGQWGNPMSPSDEPGWENDEGAALYPIRWAELNRPPDVPKMDEE